jgi:hypothetical protein
MAVKGIAKQEALNRLHLRDTCEVDEANETPISGAQLPNGWFVVFMNDFTHPLTEDQNVLRLSRDCAVIGCQVEEHSMNSCAYYYENGEHRWTVTHEAARDIYNIDTFGTPPDLLSPVRAELVSRQEKEDKDNPEVDFIFDVPLVLAERICEYRHDRWKFPWGTLTFTALETADAAST